jgi:ESS family glutamate:Na+ symporter
MQLNPHYSLVAAILVLFLGKFLNQKVTFLREYNIPSPVSGGLTIALALTGLYVATGIEVTFSLHQRDTYMIMFFTTLGLSTRIATLVQGGRALAILWLAAVAYLFLQNFTGAGVAKVLGEPVAVGVLGGSIALSGGHGTAVAWADYFYQHYGIRNAMEIGVACATFGLVLGGMVGGPIAHWLINKYQLEATSSEPITVGMQRSSPAQIDADAVLWILLQIGIAIGLGLYLHDGLQWSGLQLPTFVSCLLAGIVVGNTLPRLIPSLARIAGAPALALVSDLTLGLFLALSLISIQLWTLVDIALPLLLLLGMQVLVLTLFVVFVVFPALGKTYDSAVIAAGYAGLALGATPTAVANMTAITDRFGAAPTAFLVVPLVGAFFIDISNAIVIKIVLSWLY